MEDARDQTEELESFPLYSSRDYAVMAVIAILVLTGCVVFSVGEMIDLMTVA